MEVWCPPQVVLSKAPSSHMVCAEEAKNQSKQIITKIPVRQKAKGRGPQGPGLLFYSKMKNMKMKCRGVDNYKGENANM